MLEARGVSVAFGRKPVLRDVSLEVEAGEVVALIGPNGAGKSTLLACLTGALRPDEGQIRMDGADPSVMPADALARQRAVLDQSPVLSTFFRVDELIGIALPRDVPPKTVREITLRAADALGLTGLMGQPVPRLSGGEQHRAHMARALAQLWGGNHLGGGRWLLLDEPTASLDLGHQDSVLKSARDAALGGAGVLAVLHDLSLAAAVADRIALMHHGRIAAIGPASEVLTPAALEPVYGIPVDVSRLAGGRMAITPLYSRVDASVPG